MDTTKRPNLIEFEHGKLIAGEVNYIAKVPAAAGTYKRGDLLELVITSGAAATTWVKATDAVIGNYYAVCADDVTVETADAGQEIVCYKEGYFNENVLKVKGAAATAAQKKILTVKNIFVTSVK